MRYVAQHLKNIDSVLDLCTKITNTNGTILILEGDNTKTWYYPNIKPLVKMYDAIKIQRKQVGADLDIMDSLNSRIKKTKDWKITNTENYIVPSTLEGYKSRLTYLEEEIINLMSQLQFFPFDFSKLNKEWGEWRLLKNRYIQIGLKSMEICKQSIY